MKSNYKDEKVSDNMMIFSAQAKFGDHFNSEEYREIVLKVRKSGTIKPLIKEL